MATSGGAKAPSKSSSSSASKKPSDAENRRAAQSKPEQSGNVQPDTVEQIEQPKAVQKAAEQASKRSDELQDIQARSVLRNLTNVPSEGVSTAYGRKPDSDDHVAVTFARVGQNVIVYVDDKEIAVFSREDWLGFLRHADHIGTAL